MSDPQAPAAPGTAAPADPPAQPQPMLPAATPASGTTAPAEPPPARTDDSPPWLPDRLAKAEAKGEKAALAALGFESTDAAKAAMAELKKLQDAQLSEHERAQQQIAELSSKAQRLDVVEARFAAMVEAQLKQAPDRIRETIETEAGDSVDRRWDYLQAFAKAGVLNQVPADVPAAPKPATTTPPGTPPAAVPPQTKRDEWKQLATTPGCEELGATSIAGQLFYQRNLSEINSEPTK